ncbi:pantoate--beta-alanine ligase [Flavobacteriaceae bacterium R38]|nr:pantoate--beta-alanine ligase [Flavobacteriaceae bacterium R38]
MKIFQHKKTIMAYLERYTDKNIGLVPTMGALHDGHLSLVEQSVVENDLTVVSIFINPTQFDNNNDLEKYPKTFENDIAKLKSVSEHLIVFSPTTEEMYAKNITSQKFQFDGLESEMEGKHRLGHFDGVGTIVKRFFEIIKPDNAYFGEKDYQQLQIIKTLVKKLNIPVNIVGCPIKREENGLAMSSRNERLPKEIRHKAAVIYKTLKKAKEMFGTKSANEIKEWVNVYFDENPDFKLEYFEIANANTLKSIKQKTQNTKYRAFIAVYADDIRLIDNIALN